MNHFEARNPRKPHLSLRRCGYGSSSPRAFSLIEVLLAIFILGIGVIGIAALFPAGIAQQQRSVDDIMGPIAANNALATLRSKLDQDDFGSYENFPPPTTSPGYAPGYAPEFENVGTIRSDWLWRPPAVLFEDDTSTRYIDERGAIDIFSSNSSVAMSSVNPRIPYNWRKLDYPAPTDLSDASLAPTVLFTRGERMYPNSNHVRKVGVEEPPQYYWDCLFRRFQGRILVAVFVYRVTVPASEDYVYSVPPNPAALGVPYVPYQFDFGYDLTDPGDTPPWHDMLDAVEAWPSGMQEVYARTEIPETDGSDPSQPWGSAVDPANPDHHWQYTGQWLLDQNNNVHRVLAGRDKDPSQPVELADRIPLMPRHSIYFYDRDPDGDGVYNNTANVGVENVITNLWYIPRRVKVNLDATGFTPAGAADTWITLTPVYLTVEEL